MCAQFQYVFSPGVILAQMFDSLYLDRVWSPIQTGSSGCIMCTNQYCTAKGCCSKLRTIVQVDAIRDSACCKYLIPGRRQRSSSRLLSFYQIIISRRYLFVAGRMFAARPENASTSATNSSSLDEGDFTNVRGCASAAVYCLPDT